jgi:D-glycero-alpha-D-manno-heptose-7-phosphate kinase
MLFFTGIKRTASVIAQSYAHNIASQDQQMRLLGDMVNEGIAILTGRQEMTSFGKLLHEAWQIKRSLSSQVSNAYIEEIYNEAMVAGAIGGKVLGAGGGGFILFFVHPSDKARVRQRLHRLIHVPFTFEFSGSQIIFFDRQEEYVAEEQDRADHDIAGFTEAHDLVANQ